MTSFTPGAGEGMGELIARLEKAVGPSEELDARIWNAVYGHKDSWVMESRINGKWLVFEKCARRGERLVEVPGVRQNQPYTSSLDAALTLIPDALTKTPAWWGVRRGGLTYFHAWVGEMDPFDTEGCPQGHWAQMDTPAIALCIAALRSRATPTPEER